MLLWGFVHSSKNQYYKQWNSNDGAIQKSYGNHTKDGRMSRDMSVAGEPVPPYWYKPWPKGAYIPIARLPGPPDWYNGEAIAQGSSLTLKFPNRWWRMSTKRRMTTVIVPHEEERSLMTFWAKADRRLTTHWDTHTRKLDFWLGKWSLRIKRVVGEFWAN